MKAFWIAAMALLSGGAFAQTAEQDHRLMLDRLGIQSLRPAADPRDPQSANAPNYDESKANPYPRLPDALVLKNGERVTTPQLWWRERRAQIVEDFDREVYGRVPTTLPTVRWEVIATTQEKIGATPVITKQVVGHVDNSTYPQVAVDIELSVTTPAQSAAAVPMVMELWFRPPSTVPAPTGPDWREQVLQKGWGFALLTPTSIQADNGAGLTSGIIGLANNGQPRKPDDWGALRAWAWGASRALDYLETDRHVDATRVAIEGLSRYGKAALVAMAYEPRFAIGFIGSSGAGGAKLHRRDFGERVENLAAPSEYHWMAGHYLKYAGPLTAKDLPVDAHELIALAAPRPLFIGAGSPEVEGGWIDARGMFMAAAAAGPVYRLLGRKDLGTSTQPPQETALVSGDLAYRQHSGGHTNAPNWPTFLAFAERYFHGKPLLSSLFRDHSVLQRDRPVRLWGWAQPGEGVSISIAGHIVKTQASADGRWLATIPPVSAGGPHVLAVQTDTGATAKSTDVLLGDVWLCSGQSNMVLQVSRTLNSRSEIARSANDTIRMLTLELADRPTPLEDVASVAPWLAASPATTPEFSAACFYMARELQKTIKVPMGLINSSWGGSRIQAWMSAASLHDVGGYDESLALLETRARDASAGLARWGELIQEWWRARIPDSQPWAASAETSRDWATVPNPTAPWEEWGVTSLAQFNGIVWYRTSLTLTEQQAVQSSTLTFGPIDEVDTTWVNGKPVGYTSGAGTNRSYPLAAGTLRAGVNTIAVAALDTYADGGMGGTLEQRALELADGTVIPIRGEWKYEAAPPNLGPPPRAPWESTGGMTTIYNAMIAPLVPYTVRGVVWYQGESNTEDAGQYGKLMSAWMADWRKRFESPSLPFLVVQLANYGPAAITPGESDWATLREAQRQTVANDENAALAVAIDIGDRYDIHPTNKQELARRLARAARHVAYGEKIAPSGPVPRRASRAAGSVVVEFADVEGRLVAQGSSSAMGFELCGPSASSCQYTSGKVDGNRVTLELPAAMTQPTRVRYGWADSPICTVFDESGLPAGPFEMAIR